MKKISTSEKITRENMKKISYKDFKKYLKNTKNVWHCPTRYAKIKIWVAYHVCSIKKEYCMNKEKRVTFRIEEESFEQLQNIAKLHEIPVSMLLRQITKEYLKNGNTTQKKRSWKTPV